MAKRELGHTLVPAANHLADSNLRAEWLATVTRRVELVAIGLQRTNVVHVDHISCLREGLAIAWRNRFHIHTHAAQDLVVSG